jgi:hypothetical protein
MTPVANVIKLFKVVIYCHSMGLFLICVINQCYCNNYHRFAVNFHGKKFCNIGIEW